MVDRRIEGWVDSDQTRAMIDRGWKIKVRAIGAMPRGRHSHGESRANAVQSQGRVEQRPRPVISNECEAAHKTETLFLRHACFATPANFNYLLKLTTKLRASNAVRGSIPICFYRRMGFCLADVTHDSIMSYATSCE